MSKIGFSIEIFPPKITDGIESVYRPIEAFCKLNPDFISVTYSAGGSAQGLTGEVCEFIKNVRGIESVAHLTCADSSKIYIDNYLDKLHYAGIKYVLALRGDLTSERKLTDYRFACDLIRDINLKGGFGIFAACYPEGHKDSPSMDMDVRIMKLKEDLGTSKFISQLFFDCSDFFKMRDSARAAGVKSEIAAGIMPVTNPKQIVRMVQLSGAKIPNKLAKIIAKYEYDPRGMYLSGIDYAVEQSTILVKNGVEALHLYAMNNADVAERYCSGLGSILDR